MTVANVAPDDILKSLACATERAMVVSVTHVVTKGVGDICDVYSNTCLGGKRGLATVSSCDSDVVLWGLFSV